MVFKTAICVAFTLLSMAGSIFGQEQFLKEGQQYKGLYAGFSNSDQSTAISAGLLLAPSNQVGVGIGFSKITTGGVSTWVAGGSVSAWPVNELKQRTPVSLCLFAAYEMTVRRVPDYPEWAYALGARMAKNINLSSQHVLQPYGGISFQKFESQTDEFLQVGHVGITFAARNEKGGMGFLTLEGSFFEDVSAISIILGILGPQ